MYKFVRFTFGKHGINIQGTQAYTDYQGMVANETVGFCKLHDYRWPLYVIKISMIFGSTHPINQCPKSFGQQVHYSSSANSIVILSIHVVVSWLSQFLSGWCENRIWLVSPLMHLMTKCITRIVLCGVMFMKTFDKYNVVNMIGSFRELSVWNMLCILHTVYITQNENFVSFTAS